MSKEPVQIALNPEQQLVAEHLRGPMLCPAVAGSGKSTAIVGRMKKLVTVHNVPPQRILLVAFNVDAAKSLTKRVYAQVPWMMDSGEVARTTHSIALRIFQQEIDPKKEWKIDSSGALYAQAVRQAGRVIGLTDVPLGLAKYVASRVKNDLVPYNEAMARLGGSGSSVNSRIYAVAEEAIAQARERSQSKTTATPGMLVDIFFGAESVRTEGLYTDAGTVKFLGFDDMLHSTALLLREDEARKRWASKFDYVIVDEAQDLNRAQQAIVVGLASSSLNLMVVGDAAQCVYIFRGANPDFLADFQDNYPATKIVRMVRNYRSGQRIIDCANRVLEMMPDKIRAGMSIHGERDDLGFVNYRTMADTESEAEAVAANIKAHQATGTDWRAMAVLVRTIAQTKAIEMALLDAKVPTRMVSGQSFFSLRETKILLAYLRVALGKASKEDFGLCVMYPNRFLGKAFVQKIVERAHQVDGQDVHQDWVDILDVALPTLDAKQRESAREWVALMRSLRAKHDVSGHTPLRLVTDVIELTRFREWLGNSDDIEADSASGENVERVTEFVADFATGKALFERLSELQEQQRLSSGARNAVSVSTVHKSKGLEFSVVFIIGMADGIFPIKSDADEEDRIAYVAVTRARDELWLSRPMTDHRSRMTKPSPYVEKMGLMADDKPMGTQILKRGQLALLGEPKK
jgi:DNA helicase-2/ATP-dependent DNA helicase PcrA